MNREKLNNFFGLIVLLGFLVLIAASIGPNGLLKIAMIGSFGLACWLIIVLTKNTYGLNHGEGPPKHPIAMIFMMTIGPIIIFGCVAFAWKILFEKFL